MKNLSDLEKKINSELTTKVKDSKLNHNQIYLNIENEDLIAVENAPITNFIEDYDSSLLQLETTNIVSSKGQIPLGNWTLNSSTSPVGYQSVVHASEIRVRSTGEIALEDSTDTTYGFLVLNGTDSSSTNAGDNIDCEGATGIAA